MLDWPDELEEMRTAVRAFVDREIVPRANDSTASSWSGVVFFRTLSSRE